MVPDRSPRCLTFGDAPEGCDFVSDSIVEALIVDLLVWLANRERTYEETMDAWRISCPRLPIWEDANDRGLIEMQWVNGRRMVRVSASGVALLESVGRVKDCNLSYATH